MGRFSSDDGYVDTPQGLFTASGLWFHTTEKLLADYAGDVFDHVSLEKLVQQAAYWIRLPEIAALWSLPLWLFLMSPWLALTATFGVYLVCCAVGPGLAHPALSPLLKWMDHPVPQAAVYAAVLSVFAVGGQIWPVVIGLAAFVAFRWGLVRRAVMPLLRPLLTEYYRPSVPDHVLHALIHHTALRYDVSLPATDRIKRAISKRHFS